MSKFIRCFKSNLMQNYLPSVINAFRSYKTLGEKAMAQVSDDKLFWQFNAESNSIATIVKHLSGNMLSRWTDFLSTDGEKDWRNRDVEFINDVKSRVELVKIWDKGWACMFDTIENLKEEDMERVVFIRKEAHSVVQAINRQLAHYAYHIGQIVFVGKMIADQNWTSLSIPKAKVLKE